MIVMSPAHVDQISDDAGIDDDRRRFHDGCMLDELVYLDRQVYPSGMVMGGPPV
jgi:hypothetical protein